MKKLLILHAGPAPESMSRSYGDFDTIIMNAAGLKDSDTKVVQVYKNIMPKDIDNVAAIIISGSISMITDAEEWSTNTENWLLSIVDKGIPILGICYGHQLISHALGGVVDYHPNGMEYGDVEITLSEDGEKDSLLGVLPKIFHGYAAHSQSVRVLPDKAKILASNSFEPHHAVAYSDKIWGLQFHPEFNADITRCILQINSTALSSEGHDVKALSAAVRDNEYGEKLLHRFIELSIYNK